MLLLVHKQKTYLKALKMQRMMQLYMLMLQMTQLLKKKFLKQLKIQIKNFTLNLQELNGFLKEKI